MLTDARAVESLLLDSIAATSGLPREALGRATRLLDANLDSLTLLSLVTQVEIVFGIDFASDELAALLDAHDIGGLCDGIERKLRERRG